MTDAATPGSVPPYVSFGTLLNQIERMEREGVPGRIDGTYLVGMAGGTRSQFKVCLRSLGLIDENSHTTPALIALAENADQRQELLADILRSQFPELAALNGNATRGQLEDVMAEYGLTNADTRRKAIGFYLAAATYAGFTLSPHLRPAKRAASASMPRRSRLAKKQGSAAQPARRGDGPASQPAPTADARRAYFDHLLSLSQQAPDDKDLLDRIERLIQASGESAQSGVGV
jgi:Family of unknown function (DUF5343)